MTIPKRQKRGRPKRLPTLENKEISFPQEDKMVKIYPRYCPFCHEGRYSAECICGRFTIVTKGGLNG
jgi:hypothetical protein